MSTLFLLAASLVAVAYAATALCLAHAKANGEAEGFALTGAFAFFGGVVGLLLHVALAFGPDLREYCHEHLPWWLGAVLQGVVAGLLVAVGWRAWQLTWSAYWWTRGRRSKTTGFAVRRHLWTVAAVALVFVAISAPGGSADPPGWYDLTEWLISLVFISSLPIIQTWLEPWIIYQRAAPLDPSEHGEIHRWLGAMRKAHNLPEFHVRVQKGKAVYAMAATDPRRHFIVLGRGLLQRLPTEHVKAALAHEIAHVVNGDTMRRALPLILVSGCLHLLFFKLVVVPMDNFWIEAPCVAIGVLFFWFGLPGIFRHQWEYQADRKAVELTGDAEVVARCLIRIYEANHVGIDTLDWQHPTLRARLEAIRSLGKENPDANAAT